MGTFLKIRTKKIKKKTKYRYGTRGTLLFFWHGTGTGTLHKSTDSVPVPVPKKVPRGTRYRRYFSTVAVLPTYAYNKMENKQVIE